MKPDKSLYNKLKNIQEKIDWDSIRKTTEESYIANLPELERLDKEAEQYYDWLANHDDFPPS